MSYFARLVEQSGLTIEGRAPRLAPKADQAPEQPNEGIEEVDLLVPAPPLSAPDVPQPAATASDSPPEVIPSATAPFDVPGVPVAPAPDGDRAPDKVRKVPIEEPPAAIGEQTQGSRIEPSEPPPPDETATEIRITRPQVLRQVYEWVATNDDGATAPQDRPEPSSPKAETEAPEFPPPEPTPRAEIVSVVPARRIGTRESDEREDPPATLVEISEPPVTASPVEVPCPEPREERIDITIGTINLTLESPSPPLTKDPPIPPAPAPVPQPPTRSRRASTAPAADRLRRRFIRV